MKGEELSIRECPFCGGKADWNEEENHGAWYYVECLNAFKGKCVLHNTRMSRYDTKGAAIAAWNQRPANPAGKVVLSDIAEAQQCEDLIRATTSWRTDRLSVDLWDFTNERLTPGKRYKITIRELEG